MGIHVVNRSKGNEVAGTAVGDVLLREFKHGLHQLVGTRIVAAIEVSESVLQKALQHVRGIPRTMTVSVGPANQIIVGYGAFHATAVLAPMMDPRAPRIELELRSTILAWGLQRAINIPSVSVSGRRVAIDLDRVPALAELRRRVAASPRCPVRDGRGKVIRAR